MNTRFYIGIDPGLDGACAIVDAEGGLIEIFPTPTINIGKGSKRDYDAAAMRKWLANLGYPDFTNYEGGHLDDRVISFPAKPKLFACIEKQQSMPEQGVASTFKTGYGYGLWLGLLTGLEIPFRVVHPRTWKKGMLRDLPGDDQKGRSILAAQRMFPGVDLKRTPRCKGPDHNICEAILIAVFGRKSSETSASGV